MENQPGNFTDSKYQVKLISLISLGMFLFMLFFHPFQYKLENFDDRLIFNFGVAVITFLILVLIRIILPVSVTKRIHIESIKISNEVSLILLIWIILSIANILYLVFVGKTEISLSVAVQISIFSSFPSIVLKLADVNKSLREQMRHFARRNMKLEQDLFDTNNKKPEKIVLFSDSKNDKIELFNNEIMLVKAADNYVEIIYNRDNEISKKLLRVPLKNIQQELSGFDDFIRCHRTCIVNSGYILNMTNSYKGHRLILIDFDEEIPVSRQYILGIKEILDAEN